MFESFFVTAVSSCMFESSCSFLNALTISNSRVREASHIDFVHEKRHMFVWGWGLAVVAFLDSFFLKS